MRPDRLYLGVDVGTSGARAIVIDDDARTVAHGAAPITMDGRNPARWWQAVAAAMQQALAAVDRKRVAAIAVDGTSGTVVAVDTAGAPLAHALMYNDTCTDADILARIDHHAPATSAARGAASGLARAHQLLGLKPHKVLHQADWIGFCLSGRMVSDANNALKTGYSATARRWDDWIAHTGMVTGVLPEVVDPGTAVGTITNAAAHDFDLPTDTRMVAGTTDGCASFLATGAAQPGDGVTVLGTTLTLKMLSEVEICAPEFGIYSHRLLGMWLAGGASNSGGAALLAHFDVTAMDRLSLRIDAETDTGLDYYPLPKPGERFPIADPGLAPRVAPRPADDAIFLQGLFEGIATIEALAYRQLTALGASPLASVRSMGGGAANPAWSRLRARRLMVPMLQPISDQAAYGTALLARRGAA